MKTLNSIVVAMIASAGIMLASCNQRSDSYAPGGPAGNPSGAHETASGGSVEGTVESYDNGTLVVADKAGKESHFQVGKVVDVKVGDDGVKVNVGPRRLHRDDLKKGVRVRVNTDEQGNVVSVTAGDEAK